jgi:MFS transporter, FSR family, fosmidomycin resistance protein
VLNEAVPVAPERSARARNVAGEVRLLLTPPILMAFAYFVLVAASMSAVSTFSVVALVAIYDAPLTLAAGALTAYMLGSAAGVVGGGLLADRMRRHAIFAAAGMAIAAALTVVLASGLPPTAALAALLALIGFAKGATNPSRDLLVRGATPAGASGRVFGFVYSGLAGRRHAGHAADLRMADRSGRATRDLPRRGRADGAHDAHRPRSRPPRRGGTNAQ